MFFESTSTVTLANDLQRNNMHSSISHKISLTKDAIALLGKESERRADLELDMFECHRLQYLLSFKDSVVTLSFKDMLTFKDLIEAKI